MADYAKLTVKNRTPSEMIKKRRKENYRYILIKYKRWEKTPLGHLWPSSTKQNYTNQ